MEEKIIGLLKDISQLVIGTVVSETDEVAVLKDTAILGISPKNGQINVNFIPLDLLSLEPVIGLRNMMKNPSAELPFTFRKDSVLLYGIELADNVVDNYKRAFGKTPALVVPPNVPVPSQNSDIVKLF